MASSKSLLPHGGSPAWSSNSGLSENSTNNSSSYTSSSSSSSKPSLRGLLCVFGGIVLQVALGTVYTFGVASIYFISYLKIHSNPTIRMSAAASLMAAEFSAMAIGMPLGGVVEKHCGPKVGSLLGGLVFVGGVFISQYTIKVSFVAFLLSYAVLYGLGLGVAYTSPLVAALRWFPQHQGLISGLITAGFGLGSVVFAPVQQHLLNPSGASPTWAPYPKSPQELYYNNPTILDRVPRLFPYIAGMYLAFVLLAVCLICNPNKQQQQLQQQQQQQEQEQQLKLGDMLLSRPFLLLSIMFLLQGINIIFVATFWKTLAGAAVQKQQLTETQLAAVAAAGSACNAMGRIIWGNFADRTTFQHALCLLSAIWGIAMVLLSFAAGIHWAVYAGAVCLNFFCLGGNFSLFPAATATVFGRAAVGRVYGFVFSAQLGSSLLTAFLIPLLTQHLGIFSSCRLLSSCCFAVATLLLALRATSVWETFRHKAPHLPH